MVNPRLQSQAQEVRRISTLGVVGTYFYPNGHGHFPNEIMPRLLALHQRIPAEVPLLWPDSGLARKILAELQSMGEFQGRQIIFHNTQHLIYADLIYLYTFTDDSAYRSNFAAATASEFRSLTAMFRRAIISASILMPTKFDHGKTRIVFWGREDGSSRSISNMREVKESLSEFANEITYMVPSSGKGYFEQASILQHTRFFISPHGASMTNVLFLSENAVAVEIVYVDLSYRWPEEYYCLSRAIGVRYYMTAASGSHGTQLTVLFPDELRQIIVMNNATL